ncbi:CobD/CbiB family cobalamin biosynthesis protein [Halobellus ordinarius]|uniref:CobD/CbiB family cobalamin biosynthesis protein n=1 Tax=Halobellus ordinarius TaxID=3075120 RepID=UPI0028800733|nr:CobD/CbiB family cobalamin biosynthesis protein [Halobellus sp. ZY16]
MPVTATVAIALAAGFDAVLGEPPTRVHPVALLGRLVARVDRGDGGGERNDGMESDGDRPGGDPVWSRPRLVGLLVAFVLPLSFAAIAAGFVAVGAWINHWLGAVVAAGVLFSTTSLRLLLAEARTVISESDADLAAARVDLRALAGRDSDDLNPAHVRSAAVESLAENLADGFVAPLFAFALGAVAAATLVGPGVSLPLAAAAAAWVKGVNTLDSMLGYRSKPVGWASARLDDAVIWLPARLTALLIAVAAGAPTLVLRRRVRGLARRPASPNSGWPMATMAALLPARLHKPGVYDLDPRDSAPLPDVATAARAVRMTRRAGIIAVGAAGVLAWF